MIKSINILSILKLKCEYVFWFKINKELFHTDEDVYFGSICSTSKH